MENPFSNVNSPGLRPSSLNEGGLVKEPSEPSLVSSIGGSASGGKGGQGELTLKGQNGGVEFETRRSELPLPVRSHADRLYAAIKNIYAKYGVSSVAELHAKIASGKKPRNLKPGELKSDSAELSRLVDKLQGLLERKGFAPGEEFEAKKEMLYETERAKLSEFFEREIQVPPLPEEITLERMERWEALGLELHYLPPIDMAKEGDLKKWVKPDFKNVDPSQFPKDVMLLPGRWVLSDGRRKPRYENGNQNYENDGNFLGPVLEMLRKKGLIENFKHPRSRFNVSPEELEKPEVAAAIAQAMGLEPGQVSLPRMVEFNVIGNIHHPEWGQPPSDCGEWFADKYQARQRRLSGGLSDDGGLAYVNWCDPVDRGDDVGFRPIGCFS